MPPSQRDGSTTITFAPASAAPRAAATPLAVAPYTQTSVAADAAASRRGFNASPAKVAVVAWRKCRRLGLIVGLVSMVAEGSSTVLDLK